MPNDQEAFWHATYGEMHRSGDPWLDYATEAEQLTTFGLALLAAGPVSGARVADAACGRGAFARMLRVLGAREVVGADIVEPTIVQLRAEVPGIEWIAGTVNDPAFCASLGRFDAVFALEMLQYLAQPTALPNLWSMVAPGGRLVGVVPNADNPFVQRTRETYQGKYAPPTAAGLLEGLALLPGVEDWGVSGLVWRAERKSVLYDLTPFTRGPAWADPPKRLLFLARRGV